MERNTNDEDTIPSRDLEKDDGNGTPTRGSTDEEKKP